jgi:hypothetical protein
MSIAGIILASAALLAQADNPYPLEKIASELRYGCDLYPHLATEAVKLVNEPDFPKARHSDKWAQLTYQARLAELREQIHRLAEVRQQRENLVGVLKKKGLPVRVDQDGRVWIGSQFWAEQVGHPYAWKLYRMLGDEKVCHFGPARESSIVYEVQAIRSWLP